MSLITLAATPIILFGTIATVKLSTFGKGVYNTGNKKIAYDDDKYEDSNALLSDV